MTQEARFDPLQYLDLPANAGMTFEQATKQARADRDVCLRHWRKEGKNAKGWSLTGQLRKYKSFGEPDGRTRTVYYVSIYPQ